jgi:hypothetical protein
MSKVEIQSKLAESDDSEKRVLQANDNHSINRMFRFMWIGLIMFLMPYLYFANLINTYGHQNAPENFQFPDYRDLLPAITLIFVVGLI